MGRAIRDRGSVRRHGRPLRVLPRHAARRDERRRADRRCLGDHPGRLRDRHRRRPVGRPDRRHRLRDRRRRARLDRAPARARAALAAGVGLALLAALGFGFYFPWMHAAGKVDFWWASLVFRTTALLLIASAVAVRRPQLRLTPAPARDRLRRRDRRHDRQRALRRVVRTGPGQPDRRARLALSDRDRDPGRRRPPRARRAAPEGGHRADAGRRRADRRLTVRR